MKGKAKYVRLVAIVATGVVLILSLIAASVPEKPAGSTPTRTNPEPDPEPSRETAAARPASPLESSWPYVELDPEDVRKRRG
ncbi:MAG: hypothetical protein ACLFUM_07375 [Spirochaetaceae bacterium]